MRLHDGRILLSPSDLSSYLACRHLTRLDVAVQRGEMPAPIPYPNPQADLIARKGSEHEAAFLAELERQGRRVTRIPFEDHDFDAAAAATEEAIHGGADVVYQGLLASGGWRGFADFLVRLDGGTYEAWDTKLARHAKPSAVLQLTFYSHELERIQDSLPERMHVVLGTGRTETYRPGDFAAFYRRARERLEDAVAEPRDTYPWRVEHCRICDHWQLCRDRWREDDHLNGVANISRSQIERLTAAGIPTLEALGDAPPGTAVPRLASSSFGTLRHQASLQLAQRRTGVPRYDLLEPAERRGLGLLPEPSPGDLFYDIEGDPWWEPGRGLEYLHGITDAEGRFGAVWAHDRDEERRALEAVIGRFHAALAECPGMHVYHYAAYETSALKRLTAEHGVLEDALDDLLRREVFVDLYTVTRQALRVSYPSYSIKEVRKFFMEASTEVEGGGEAMVEYERWMEERDDAILEAIRAYNEEDCLSNLRLRDWLLERREEAERQFGVAIPWRAPPDVREPSEEKADAIAGRTELRRALAASGDEALGLAASLLEYHRREARPVWWWFFARGEMTPAELVEDSESIGQLEPDGTVEKVARSEAHGMRFPVQQHSLDPGDEVFDPATLTDAGSIHEIDAVAGTLKLKRGPRLADAPLPEGLIPGGAWPTKAQQAALMRLGRSLLAGDGRYPHLEKLLRREPPLGGRRVQCEGLEALRRLIGEVEGSYLFVQGPPGSGKTWTGARLITHLVSCGKRVGVASQSHKAIHKLLAEIERAAGAEGVSFRGLKKASGGGETVWDTDFFDSTEDNADFVGADHDVFAGTAWLMAREELDGALDYLFIDEAGQTSLADALAMGTCARTLVLLGDPVQLAQVTQAVHPDDAGRSVLAHLLGERATVDEELGVFLPESWRMHPDVCEFVSDAFYDGRLGSHVSCAERTTPLGTGLRWLDVEHEGNSTSSEQEAAAIRAEIDRLLAAGTKARDVMVVAPFNAQVRLLSERLQEGVDVGTVDKFQGQEAPVVFFSMASSSGEDAPRGIDFLMSRNRLNVAVSRAQCLAYLVCAPALLDVDCRTVEQMRLANALCRFVELAGEG